MNRISPERLSEIESGARYEFGASPARQHKYTDSEVMGVCMDLRDASATIASLRAENERLSTYAKTQVGAGLVAAREADGLRAALEEITSTVAEVKKRNTEEFMKHLVDRYKRARAALNPISRDEEGKP